MKHTEVLKTAALTLSARGRQYGPEEECFDRIAKLASIILNKNISPYDIAMIQVATKLGRLQEDRINSDSYVDGVNYLAFAAQFAGAQSSIETAVEDDTAAMIAKKFANLKAQENAAQSQTSQTVTFTPKPDEISS
jgi:hypothetical protein